MISSEWLRSINRSLLTAPPPQEEISGNDICYLGPEGHDDEEGVIYCKDLEDGMRSMVGSWYLTPERHIAEYTVVTILSVIVLVTILNNLPHYPDRKNIENGKKSHLHPPTFLCIITAFFCALMVVYKVSGYPGKVLFLFMPCNLNWCMAFALCFFPNLSSGSCNALCQLWVGFSGLAVVALATPDVSDLVLPGETIYYFINHVVLLIFPLYYLCTGKITLLPMPNSGEGFMGNFMKWYLLNVSTFCFMYVTIVTPVSIYSGLNINYMLSPPPSPGNLITGPNYRLQSSVCVMLLFFVTRIFATAMEFAIRAIAQCPFEVHANLPSRKSKKL